MKSLEIVNERIEDLESRLESANYLANGNPSEFGKIFIGDLSKQLNGFKQIKQDLEVLEIIINKKVNVAIFMNFLKIEDNEKILEIYNYINYAQSKLTLEEIVKLKQWLEVN